MTVAEMVPIEHGRPDSPERQQARALEAPK